MLPSIEIKISKNINYNFKKSILDLLKYVPKEDLIGLQKIVMLDKPYGKWSKEYKESEGWYWEKSQSRPASIELFYNNLYRKLPSCFFLIPFLPQFIISSTLFHEIGHHAQRMKHGIQKEKKEKDAEAYKRQYYKDYLKYLQRAKFIWKPFSTIFLRPHLRKQQKDKILELKAKIKSNPADHISLTNIARLYYDCGYIKLPLRLLNKSLKINDKHINTYWGLISVFMKKKQNTKAKDLLQKMITLFPDNKDIYKWQKRLNGLIKKDRNR